MKTAISLPNRVDREAEGYAKRTRKSRSQLYAEVLAEYLARHAPDDVTDAMNTVVDELGDAAPDPFVEGAGRPAYALSSSRIGRGINSHRSGGRA
jgi:hypothetical protein